MDVLALVAGWTAFHSREAVAQMRDGSGAMYCQAVVTLFVVGNSGTHVERPFTGQIVSFVIMDAMALT